MITLAGLSCLSQQKANYETETKKKEMTPMKRLMKTIVRGALAALLVLTFTPLLASGGEKIEGSWNVTVTVVNCTTGVPSATFPRMNTFALGGTMQEFSAFVAPSLRGPGQGVWSHSLNGHFSYDIQFFRFNPDGTFAGWVREKRDVVVDVSGNTYQATGTGKVFSANGTLLFSSCATETGTRAF